MVPAYPNVMFPLATLNVLHVNDGTDTEAVPLDPLCVKVSVLVGFGATDPITF